LQACGRAMGHRWQAQWQDARHRHTGGLFGRLLRLPRDPWPWRAWRAADHGGIDVAGGPGLQLCQGHIRQYSALCGVFSLKNRIDIQIRPASFRTIRGITAIAAIAEETSMWQSDEFGSRNPDREILDVRGLLGVHSRCGLHTRAVTVFRDPLSEGFRHFVTSMPAPVASGWSDRRVGLAPTGKRRLFTAHTQSGNSAHSSR
jgi:hypothetical protein